MSDNEEIINKIIDRYKKQQIKLPKQPPIKTIDMVFNDV